MPNFNWNANFEVQKDPPMGILYIASALEQHGFDVRIIDANLGNLTMDEVVWRCRDSSVVGISCNYAPLHNVTLHLCAALKRVNPHIRTVVGGNHATALSKMLLRQSHGTIDYIVRGQGETVFPHLMRTVEHNLVYGISYVDKEGNVIENPDAPSICNLDYIPLPAYHLLDMELYDRYNIVTSRGCPYNCRYCASNVITKGKVLYRSPDCIVEEIQLLVKKYGNKHFWFCDDTFTSNYRHTDALLDCLLENQVDISWSCLTRVNLTRPELLRKMKRAGCKYISYGVESGDEAILRAMDKRITLDAVRSALLMTKAAGIDMYLFFIIGYPGDTLDSVRKSFDLIREVQPTGVGMNVLIPLPGTPLWDDLVAKGLLDPDAIEWDRLFTRTGYSDYENYSARLASQWCELTEDQIISLCGEGRCAFS